MPSFKAPSYTKSVNPKTGAQEPCYTFPIDFQEDADEPLSFVAESSSDITLQSLQKLVIENSKWWTGFLQLFLQATSKLFAKPYTIENINKITKHTLTPTANGAFPAYVTFLPKNIQIANGTFMVNWMYKMEQVVIDIPDQVESESASGNRVSLPVALSKNDTGLEEVNIDNLEMGNNSTDDSLRLENPAKFYEKQRVKEARLKAKLAVYKAQRQIAQYYEKYGADISDSDSDSDTGDDESDDDDESDEETNNDEIQL